MAKQIARLLKTNMMADIDMPSLAQFLQSQGRKGDSILAHINPKEAALLQKMGGAGTANPSTGLPEFYVDAPYQLTPERNDADYVYIPRKQPQENFFEKYGGIDFNTRDYNDPIENIALRSQPFDPYSETKKDIVRTISNRSPSSNVTTTFPKSGNQTINTNYVGDYNVTGDGGFGYSQAAGGADRFGTSPITTNRFNVPNVAKGFDEFGFPIISGADGLPFESDRSALQLDRFTVPNIAKGQDEFGFPIMPEDEILDQPTVEDNRNILRRGVDYLKELTGLSGNELARLGLAGGLGIQGALASREMAKQGQEARREQEAIAAPYRERGATLLAQAEGGQLTPQAQQSLQAMRARLQQGVESRGGVGAQQAAAQVEAFRQQLLSNQFDYGMKISNIGDNIAMGAIRTGLEADRYASKMTSDYFTNMAQILAGMGEEESPVTQQTQVRGAR
jgi:hypothetical protein